MFGIAAWLFHMNAVAVATEWGIVIVPAEHWVIRIYELNGRAGVIASAR